MPDPDQHADRSPPFDAVSAAHPMPAGPLPGAVAREAAELFAATGSAEALLLGAAHAQDATVLASMGMRVVVVDADATSLAKAAGAAAVDGLGAEVTALCLDVLRPLPFDDARFDACLVTETVLAGHAPAAAVARLATEVHRVLRPGGLCVLALSEAGAPADDRTRTALPAAGFEVVDLSPAAAAGAGASPRVARLVARRP